MAAFLPQVATSTRRVIMVGLQPSSPDGHAARVQENQDRYGTSPLCFLEFVRNGFIVLIVCSCVCVDCFVVVFFSQHQMTSCRPIRWQNVALCSIGREQKAGYCTCCLQTLRRASRRSFVIRFLAPRGPRGCCGVFCFSMLRCLTMDEHVELGFPVFRLWRLLLWPRPRTCLGREAEPWLPYCLL